MYNGRPADPFAPPPPRRSPFVLVEAPVLTYAILAVTAAVYLLQLASEQLLGTDYPASLGMKVNELIVAGQWWRLLTPMLLHGSILHIGFNMYALLILGQDVERHMGHRRFLLLYVLSGFAGNVISFLFQPADSLGASTSIFGLLAAQGVFVYQNRRLIANARDILLNVVFIAGVNLLIGLSGGIDNWGHLGGLLGGLMFSWFAGPKFQLGGEFSQTLVDARGTGDVTLASVLVLATFGGLTIWHILSG